MTATIVTRQIDAGDNVVAFAAGHHDPVDRLAVLREELIDWVAAGHQVAPLILDNVAWLAAMEDAGFIVDLATGLPVAFDATRPPTLPLL